MSEFRIGISYLGSLSTDSEEYLSKLKDLFTIICKYDKNQKIPSKAMYVIQDGIDKTFVKLFTEAAENVNFSWVPAKSSDEEFVRNCKAFYSFVDIESDYNHLYKQFEKEHSEYQVLAIPISEKNIGNAFNYWKRRR